MKNQRLYNIINNPVFKNVINQEIWTVSTKDKVPLDIVEYKLSKGQRLWGAVNHNNLCLTTAEDVLNIIPNASNLAMHINTLYQDLIVLDIEPKASDEIKEKFLKLPYLYGEKSMSGKGYHLIFNKPSNFEDFPNAMNKIALKSEDGTYELLMYKYCTFTGDTIEKPKHVEGSLEDVYAELASIQKTYNISKIELDKVKIDDIKDSDKILKVIYDNFRFTKTPADYNEDDYKSKWTYGFMGTLKKTINNVLNTVTIKKNGHNYTISERIELLYVASMKLLPDRDKHHTYREGLPYIQYLAKTMYERSETNKKDN